MKLYFHPRRLLLLAISLLASSAMASTIPLVTAGSNGPTGSRSNNWSNIYIPATCNISCFVQVTVTQSGGGGAGVGRNGTTIITVSAGGQSGTFSQSNSATAQPAGYYSVGQGFGGPPNTVNGYVETTFTW